LILCGKKDRNAYIKLGQVLLFCRVARQSSRLYVSPQNKRKRLRRLSVKDFTTRINVDFIQVEKEAMNIGLHYIKYTTNVIVHW
jgi:ribosomal protein L33